MKLILNLFFAMSIYLLLSCSASTGTRYGEEKKEKNNGTEMNENNTKEKTAEFNSSIKEDFNIKPYRTRIIIDKMNNEPGTIPPDVWYGYENENVNKSKTVTGTTDGFRVLVVSADNQEEANDVRSEIYFKTQNKEVYISFEPPFYKVKVGDFINREDANDLKFKLNQLGYPEARVIQETVNIFSE